MHTLYKPENFDVERLGFVTLYSSIKEPQNVT
jgi:hypothetical protein